MKNLYIDCSMGAAGDMLTAALMELLPNPDEFTDRLNSLKIPGVSFIKEKAEKCGITGTHMSVKINGHEEGEDEGHHHEHSDHEHHEHNHEHHHHGAEGGHDHHHSHSYEDGHTHEHSYSSMRDLEHIIRFHLPISNKVKKDILAVYRIIAEAESKVHGVPVTDIHFHEVGTMDALADITAVCMLMEELSPDRVTASPIHVGSGTVKCAHGILPVPAPATAEILKGIPIYSAEIKGELCTPTGAALLKHFVSSFGDMPPMSVSKTGYGMGKKDFERANCVRAMLGEDAASASDDFVYELSCNIDDMPPEAIGFAMDELLKGGALDVYTVPIGMKKSRPGVMLCVLCKEDRHDDMIKLIFKHTSTIGIRENVMKRYTLSREIQNVKTDFGTVHKKVSEGYGIKKEKFEYDDLAEIARRENISIADILKTIK